MAGRGTPLPPTGKPSFSRAEVPPVRIQNRLFDLMPMLGFRARFRAVGLREGSEQGSIRCLSAANMGLKLLILRKNNKPGFPSKADMVLVFHDFVQFLSLSNAYRGMSPLPPYVRLTSCEPTPISTSYLCHDPHKPQVSSVGFKASCLLKVLFRLHHPTSRSSM